MPQWLQDLISGWPMILANLPAFFTILLLMFGAVWWLMNWRYGGIISHKDSEISLLKGQRDDYKDKLSGATPDQAKARIDALETRLAALEPRRLTADQRSKLIAQLIPHFSSHETINIISEASGDSHQLAADLVSVFQAAGGWHIQEGQAMGIGNRPPSGLGIHVEDTNNLSAPAKIITGAFKSAGLAFDLRQSTLQVGISVHLLVCTKVAR